MPTEIVMPRLSDTMDSGTIARWLKHEGDQIKRGEIIAEIETDKSNMELESYSNGILAQILIGEGESAALGQPIAMIAATAEEAESMRSGSPAHTASSNGSSSGNGRTQSGESQSTPADSAQAINGASDGEAPEVRQPAVQDGSTDVESGGRIKASPLARRLAQEHDLDLRQVRGSGPGGRITKDDVRAHMRTGGHVPAASSPQSQAPVAAERPAPAPQSEGAAALRAAQPVEMTRMQHTIARRMTEARFSAPDFVLTTEVDMTEGQALLRSLKAIEGAPKVGPNDLLIKAVSIALRRHPEVNSGWENGTVMRYGRINVGFAVAIEGGLVVPVVKDSDTKALSQIAIEAKEFISRARAGKLAPHEYEGGTFSISNLGMYGIEQFTPVINIPEACIVGVGAIESKPVVVDGEIVVRDRMHVTMSCDHRVINGAQGAEFLQTLRNLLEHPMLALI